MSSKEKVIQKAKQLLSESPSGMRYSELIKKIKELLPDIPPFTISGSFHKFKTNLPSNIYQPERGLYKDTKYKESEEPIETTPIAEPQPKIGEEQFYEPFANWLVNELEECTKAIVVGGNKFGGKWGTPDVMGILEARKSDIIKPATEIISAEIKIDSQQLIVAFGQACAYKLFSHRSYIVVPEDSSEEDISRLDALARIFGIGLVLFDKTNTEDPHFQIRVRASRHEPDMFYVNKYAKLIEDELFT